MKKLLDVVNGMLANGSLRERYVYSVSGDLRAAQVFAGDDDINPVRIKSDGLTTVYYLNRQTTACSTEDEVSLSTDDPSGQFVVIITTVSRNRRALEDIDIAIYTGDQWFTSKRNTLINVRYLREVLREDGFESVTLRA
ncbi:MAG: hypothetical protein NC548_27775 [Lachnospiraceae bacterium]|nr:hypothetical protein [Lachnospiraceae bacterium]